MEVPLSLQVWSEGQLEGQLRTLIPYLNGGRTPECEMGEGEATKAATTAASSMDAVENCQLLREYKVKRNDTGTWEAATEEEAKMLRDQLLEEEKAQEEADQAAFREYESSLAQRWDDWAVRSEMDREHLQPSRKRIKVTMCVNAAGGQEVGTACVEGVIDHNQRPTVTFQGSGCPIRTRKRDSVCVGSGGSADGRLSKRSRPWPFR